MSLANPTSSCPRHRMVGSVEPTGRAVAGDRAAVGSASGRCFARLAPVLTPLIDALALTVLMLSIGTSVLVGLAYVPAVLVVLVAEGQHRLRICLRVGDQIPRVAVATAVPLVVLLPWMPLQRGVLLVLYAASLIVAVRTGTCLVLRTAHRHGRLLQPTVLLGADPRAREIAELLDQHPELGLRPYGFLDRADNGSSTPLLGDPVELSAVVARDGIARVLVCAPAMGEGELTSVLRACRPLPVDVCLVPRLAELGMAVPHGCLDEVWGVPLVPLRRWGHARVGAWIKRAFDLVVGGVLLAVMTPMVLLLAGAVRLHGGGAALFRQVRVTGTGARTSVVKLRTVDSGGGGWTVPVHRCTRLGRWLRFTHVDELPQLAHVMRAEMSLVGPRPERPCYAERFAREIPRYDDRHRMPGGMTGWAQVHGLHGDTSIVDRARFDNQYIEYWSPWLDAVIVARTLAIVAVAVLRCRTPTAQGGER